jgi:hypothetical protein
MDVQPLLIRRAIGLIEPKMERIATKWLFGQSIVRANPILGTTSWAVWYGEIGLRRHQPPLNIFTPRTREHIHHRTKA